MNSIKSALLSGHRPHPLAAAAAAAAAAAPHQQLGGAASFHSTPVLQRKRKTQWHNVIPPSSVGPSLILVLFDGQATAEEKFKHCSAAYQTLCDNLASA
ncbi:hypothetical protein BAE44_0004418 [Dichanthelium oligosanthes]|uniref:Uncharacterized protein n=1 Tax=Dichanthelium oligosanthes TaxID=888268 RepID=A0A1E5WAZ4_9POAL|nr:hypothetical protein BAE44_0004418 [Dichanthelium oligosanthes]